MSAETTKLDITINGVKDTIYLYPRDVESLLRELFVVYGWMNYAPINSYGYSPVINVYEQAKELMDEEARQHSGTWYYGDPKEEEIEELRGEFVRRIARAYGVAPIYINETIDRRCPPRRLQRFWDWLLRKFGYTRWDVFPYPEIYEADLHATEEMAAAYKREADKLLRAMSVVDFEMGCSGGPCCCAREKG